MQLSVFMADSIYSALAQSVEHAAVNRSVNGSSPLGSAIFFIFCKNFLQRWNMKKTNAMRELDKKKIKYDYKEYEVDENDLSAIAVSLKTGEDITKIFKTLVLLTEKKEMLVACIPGADTIDLKKLAKVAGVKKVEMLELKELFNMTGYIRGGCSPIGIKKRHQSFIHQSAKTKDYIMISAGVRGLQIIINPNDLIEYLNMQVGDIIV